MFKSFLGTAGLQLSGKLFTVLSGIIIARTLGPENYGRYAYVMSIIAIAVIPTVAGLPQLLIREIGLYVSSGSKTELKGLYVWSNIYTFTVSAVVCLVIWIMIYNGYIGEEVSNLLLVALVLIPIKGTLSKQTAILNAYQKPVLAQVTLNFLWPFLAFSQVVILYLISADINEVRLVYVQILSIVISLIVSLIIFNKVANLGFDGVKAHYELARWHSSLLPFMGLFIVSTLNVELAVLFVGNMLDEYYVGLFRVASQAILIISISMHSINSITAPKLVRAFSKKENINYVNAQRVLDKGVLISSVFSIPIIISLILVGDYFICFLFGSQYEDAISVLRILCIGQLFNVILGSPDMVLNYCGYEKLSLRIVAFSMLISIVSMFALIPIYGIEGAAFSVALAQFVNKGVMLLFVYSKTGLVTCLRKSINKS